MGLIVYAFSFFHVAVVICVFLFCVWVILCSLQTRVSSGGDGDRRLCGDILSMDV